MYRSIIKYLPLLCLWVSLGGHGQETARDTTKKSEAYGLRVGIDLSRPLITALNDQYEGFEIVGDFRISQRWFLAAELGNESKTVEEALENVDDINKVVLYDFTSSGSYAKVGVDFNTYQNWYGMNNSIYVGARYAFPPLVKP